MKKFLAAVIAVMMAFTLILPAMAESGLTAEILPEEAADLNEALNVPGGTLVFTTEGDYPWAVEEDWAKSTNEGEHNTSSAVSTTVTAAEGDMLSFDFQCWGEGASWDKLQLKIDGTEIIHWGEGHEEWEAYSTPLTEGEHNIEWIYFKDGSGNNAGDHALLDNVSIRPAVSVTGVEFAENEITMPLSRDYQLEWTVLPENADNKAVTFLSADSAIATVSSTGLVHSVAAGTVNISVTTVDGGFADYASVTVEPEVVVTAVEVAPAEITIPVTSSSVEWLTAKVLPENATDLSVTWASSDTAVVTVDANGKIIGKAAGSATVTATAANGVFGSCAVTVVAAEDFPGVDTLTFTPLNPLPYFDPELHIGHGEGGTPIMYKWNNGTPKYQYAVGYSIEVPANQRVVFNTYWFGGEEGQYNTPGRVDTVMTLFDAEFNYIASNDDGSGMTPYSLIEYTFDTEGTYYVVVAPYYCDKAGWCEMHAADKPPVEIESIALDDFTALSGCTVNLIDRAVITPADYEVSEFVFASSDEAVGTVDEEGIFTALAPGQTTVTITDNISGVSASAVVTVMEGAGYYFETDPALDGWTWEDHDGDGYNWEWKFSEYGATAPEGQGLMQSASWISGADPLDPDNWLISPEFPGGGSVSFTLLSQSSSYPEHIGVYASADGGQTWSDELAEFDTPVAATVYTVDLAAYAGQNIKLAFRHYNSTDEWAANLDAVEITFGAAEPTPPPAEIIGYYFETDPELDGWTWEDRDGDGNNWLWNTEFSAIEGTGCMLSHSYGAGEDLTPDNWLISPTVPGGTEVNFFIAATYDYYVLDPVGVYVTTDNGATWSEELGYFEATVAPQVCNVDLSAYAGQDIKIAFRHYDVTGGWELQLDKVLVGHPAPPTEITVEDVSVPVGRKAKVNYTVLPEDILNKNVTFTIADETIATVDEFGKVTGVAEGVTEITVASVVNPEIFGTATVTVTPELPTTWLNGYIAFDPVTGMTGVWGQFGDADPSVIEEKGPMTDTFAGAFAGGKVYGYLQSGEFYITDVTEAPYTTAYPGTKADVLVYAMAYDHANDIMYAFAQDPSTYSTNIYTVDLAIGTLTYVTAILSGEEMIFTLAIDGEGNAYGINSGDDACLWNVDLATGECTLIGSTGHALYYVQGMTWDFDSDMIYWAQYCDDANNGLCIVDPATGAAIECGAIGGAAEVTALWIRNDLEIPEIVMPDFDISFMDGFTGEEIPGGYTVEGGTVLDPEDFPIPPEHAGLEFTGWDYDGHAIYQDTVITANYRDPNAMGWYFETDPAVDGWTWEDHDGDGYNWMWINGADPDYADWGFPEGIGCMSSQSFVNYVGPLTPDNWLISPEVPGGGSVSFILCAQDGGYADEHIGVYASADGGETWSEELGYFTPKDPGPNFTFTVNLAEFAGMNIKLAFRHYDSTDAFFVNLDAVEVSAGEPEPVLPEEITVEDIVVYEGQTADAVYTVLPEDAEDKSVTFAIADETIATVDENGVVSGVAVGETEITVTSVANPEISGTATVTVIPYAPEEGDVVFDIRNHASADGLYYALPGETVTVEFTVTGEYAAHGANINFNYDPELLTIESLEEGPAMAEIRQVALPTLDYETVPGSIKLGIMAPTDPFSAQGVIYTVSFKVAETAELDTVLPLEIEIAEFFNMPVGGEAAPIPTFAYNSGIVVAAPPAPPATGFVSLAGIGIASILAGAGIVLFRKKRS